MRNTMMHIAREISGSQLSWSPVASVFAGFPCGC